MTFPRNLASYASPKANARVLANPTNCLTATEWNRLAADVAAMTCAAPLKVLAQFPTATSNGAVTPSAFWAQWGLDPASQPAIARTGTGTYTVSTPAGWTTPGTWVYSLDPAGQVLTSEQVLFGASDADIDGSVASTSSGWCRTSRSGYTITVYVYNASWALSDLSGGVPIWVIGR